MIVNGLSDGNGIFHTPNETGTDIVAYNYGTFGVGRISRPWTVDLDRQRLRRIEGRWH